jgi:RNA polymerase sigma factor (sigma-70 family)
MKQDGSQTSKSLSGRFLAAALLVTSLSALSWGNVGDVSFENLARYCTTCWRSAGVQPQSWADCTQEVFARLLERVPVSRWDQLLTWETPEREEFLRAVDTVKKRYQRARRVSPLAADVPANETDSQAEARAEQRAWVEDASRRVLTPKQQEIIRLTLDGWAVNEIATRMGLPPARVSDEKYKATQNLRRCLMHEAC